MVEKPNRYPVKSEDAETVKRISSEIGSRLLEMAAIMASTTGVMTLPTEGLSPKKIEFVTRGGTSWMEIFELPDGTSMCVGQETGGSVFLQSPCGG